MTTDELLNELVTKNKYEISIGILKLLINNKLDFNKISNLYVEYLKCKEEYNKEVLAEANTLILQSFDLNKTVLKKFKEDYSHTQRCLYFLNKFKFFKCDRLNTIYEYDKNSEKEFLNIIYKYYTKEN